MLKGFFLGGILLSFLGSFNAHADQLTLSKDCRLPADQSRSLRAPFLGVMHLIVDSTFDKSEQKSIAAAISIWNKVGQKIRGQDFFTIEVGSIPESVAQMTDLDCSKTFGGPNDTYVVNVKSNKLWKQIGLGGSHSSSEALGAVHYCSNPDEFLQQVVLLNPNIIQYPQFSSVALHELGHSLGLLHSCESNPKAASKDYVSCQRLPLFHPYRSAIMYPELKQDSPSGYPEEKLTPSANDIARLQCLYGAKNEAQLNTFIGQ